MWGKTVSLSELVGIFGSIEQKEPFGAVPHVDWPKTPPTMDETCLLWLRDPSGRPEWPNIVVVADDQEIELLAWTANFLPGFRPFTSFFRVISWTSFQEFKLAPRDQSFDDWEDVLIGATLGEALTHTRSRNSFETLPIQAFASTYSYAMARTTALRLPARVADRVRDSWERARKLVSQPARKPNVEDLDQIWTVIRNLPERPLTERPLPIESLQILDACRDLTKNRFVSERSWAELMSPQIDYRQVRAEMSERKENRVRFFERLVNDVLSRPDITIKSSFMCAFLASLISEGTLDHADLLFPVLDRVPTAVVWYGVCVGLNRANRLQSYKNGLGRRLLRDVARSEDLFSRPTADLAIDELSVFANSENQQVKIHQRSSTSMSLEIAPMVAVSIKSHLDRYDPDPPKSSPADEQDPSVAIAILGEIDRSLDRVRVLQRELSERLAKKGAPVTKRESRPKGKKRRGWLFPEDT